MAVTRKIFPVFRRQRYPGTASGNLFYPEGRERLMKELGGASKVIAHARVYDRSAVGGPAVDFDCREGGFGEEPPGNSLRSFSAAKTADSPLLPWNAANMISTPDDGTFQVSPTRGLLDLSMKVYGTGACWIEIELYVMAEYAG
jgi:hypothetical protein